MASWLRNWFENLTQTRKFHPSWILIGVIVSAFLAALVWGAAVLLTRAEADDLTPVDTRIPTGGDAVHEGAPATITPPAVPREAPQKTIQVRFLPPAAQWERIPAATPAPTPLPWARPLRRVT
ncbi:hypothetical protein Tbd_2245 [Thiobacillus denitrificans ATCC 25259]|uniref:Uncharacterized protein n=1 Tax=Thiobacillus denitrificans (strain ATCC 25259 / T1) TaxID=292415 RepID=Q3SGP9_THIDA|nr:hypothetical protein [Thiobacillus denitrificans]AAZ98198.1 hypothetical protein Tbd_2245 [Thiobacillus denitrificans ATCC 25259]